ncbi:MAG TPA: pyridoxal phosphate-dependent aminotransferase [Rhizobiales bacterium]|nr:pyridoxal phosphate-dependent aminotransferase [Hyphomicrobiales bacterium]
MSGPKYTNLVAGLPASVPFVSPDTQERLRGAPYKARLGANENGFGPSPKAIKAIQDAASDVWMYGDELSFDLRQALAEKYDIGPDNIIVGEGIDGLLGNLVRLLVEPGVNVVTSVGAYPTFNYHVNAFGGEIHAVPYKDDFEDLDGLAAKARETRPALVYLANPDNPMASWHDGAAISAFLDQLPDDTLLCLDEAYVEFAPQDSVLEMDVTDPRLIRFRTFSKAYGLAGLRTGYGMATPELISAFNKIRNHFGVNRLGQAAALAALQDQDWLAQTLNKVGAAKKRIAGIAVENGMTALPSATNFVTIDTGHDADYAKAIVKSCDDQDVFIRMPFAAPQNRCLRVSAGPAEEIELFADALAVAVKQNGS